MSNHNYAVTVNSLQSTITVAELIAVLFPKTNEVLKTVPESVYDAMPSNVQRHFVKLGSN